MKGYLAQWSLMTYLDVRRTCELLAYLGYHTAGIDNQLTAITVTKTLRSGAAAKKQRNTRTVFMGHVIGPPGVGKTAFCQGLLGRSVDVSLYKWISFMFFYHIQYIYFSRKSTKPTCGASYLATLPGNLVFMVRAKSFFYTTLMPWVLTRSLLNKLPAM